MADLKKSTFNADNNYNAPATWKRDHLSSADISAELKIR